MKSSPTSINQSARVVATAYPRKHLFALSTCSALMVATLMLWPSSDATATRTVRLPATPELTPVVSESPTPAKPASTGVADDELLERALAAQQTLNWKPQTVRSGDTLSHLFKRAGLSFNDLQAVMDASPETKMLNRLLPGQTVEFAVSAGKLNGLRFSPSKAESLLVRQQNGKFNVEKTALALQPFTSYAEAEIQSSLFLAAQEAGLSERLTMEMANIFGWDIDFVQDIRSGDRFRVIYQEMFLNGEKIKDGSILAAQFVNKGKTYTAIRFEDKHGADYYAPDGTSLRKAFLRSPLDFARISSHFNLQRRHPVLHTIRAHKGTDYAAGRGTPIKATGDGKVVFAGNKGGYGRVVILQHGRKYQTLYAHLNGFARSLRTGSKVRQGQVIGYVGSSGLATGPHLHYEFYANGSVRNPVTVKLPDAEPVAAASKTQFLQVARRAESQLATYAAALESEKLASLE